MFILRTLFWLSLVVLVLPTDAGQQERFGKNLNAARQYAFSFCDRNAATCETGARYWQLFKKKADYGLQLAIGLIIGAPESSEEPAEMAAARNARPSRHLDYPQRRSLMPSRDTLRRDDRAAPWRGPYTSRGNYGY